MEKNGRDVKIHHICDACEGPLDLKDSGHLASSRPLCAKCTGENDLKGYTTSKTLRS